MYYVGVCVCVRVAQLFIKNCERAAEKIKESGQKSLRANLYGPFIAPDAHRIHIYLHPPALHSTVPCLKILIHAHECVLYVCVCVCMYVCARK